MKKRRMNPVIALGMGLGWLILSAADSGEVMQVTDPAKVFPLSLEEAKNFPYPYEDLIPGGWEALWPEIEARTSERGAIDNIVILHALHTYVLFEGRFPESLKVLLDSPYSAIRAADLVDPLTKKPFSEVTESDVFSHRFVVRQGTDLRTTTLVWVVRLRDPTTSAPVDVVTNPDDSDDWSLYWFLVPGPGNAKHGYRRGAVPDAVLTAEAVSHALSSSQDEFIRFHDRPPASFQELVSTFPFLKKLRNGFTGGYASATEWLVTKPSGDPEPYRGPPPAPGDFLVGPLSGGRGFWFDVFGPDGKSIRGIWPSPDDWVIYR